MGMWPTAPPIRLELFVLGRADSPGLKSIMLWFGIWK